MSILRHGGADAHAERSDASDHHAQHDAEGASSDSCRHEQESSCRPGDLSPLIHLFHTQKLPQMLKA